MLRFFASTQEILLCQDFLPAHNALKSRPCVPSAEQAHSNRCIVQNKQPSPYTAHKSYDFPNRTKQSSRDNHSPENRVQK